MILRKPYENLNLRICRGKHAHDLKFRHFVKYAISFKSRTYATQYMHYVFVLYTPTVSAIWMNKCGHSHHYIPYWNSVDNACFVLSMKIAYSYTHIQYNSLDKN